MSNPKLLSKLRQFGSGMSAESYLATEFRQNLKSIEDAFSKLSQGASIASSVGNTATQSLSGTSSLVQNFGLVFNSGVEPVVIELCPIVGVSSSYVFYTGGSSSSKVNIGLLRTRVSDGQETQLPFLSFLSGASSGSPRVSPHFFKWVDEPGPGQFVYELYGYYDGSASAAGIVGSKLIAFKMR